MTEKQEDLIQRFLHGVAATEGWTPDKLDEWMDYAATEPALNSPFERIPSWCVDAEVQLQSASGGHESEEHFDFSQWMLGVFTLHMELKHTESGVGYLCIRWSSSEPNAHGWWVTFLPTDTDNYSPLYELFLGPSRTGECLVFAGDLKFDPSCTPFRYSVTPQLP